MKDRTGYSKENEQMELQLVNVIAVLELEIVPKVQKNVRMKQCDWKSRNHVVTVTDHMRTDIQANVGKNIASTSEFTNTYVPRTPYL